MNTTFNKFCHKKIFFFLVVILLMSRNSIAQHIDVPKTSGPFEYCPPDSLVQHITDVSEILYMKDLDQFAGDGIMFSCKLNINGNDRFPVVSFCVSMLTPAISIDYSNRSFLIRRTYDRNGSKTYYYYDYQIYDQLFGGNGDYTVQIYVTANFMFIATHKIGTTDHYLSPVLFGLNLPEVDTMADFLNRRKLAMIRMDKSISNAKLYSFQYSQLRNELLTNFVNSESSIK